jgi:hypothetical protein
VTLVATKQGSEADDFLQSRLLLLSLDDTNGNPFLFRRKWKLRVSCATKFQVDKKGKKLIIKTLLSNTMFLFVL